MTKPEKVKFVEDLASEINKYPIVGILNMHKLPAPPLQKMRKKLKGKAVIKVAKKRLTNLAFDKTDKKGLKEKMAMQPGLLFTEMNPFKLYKFLKNNKSPAPAKTGDVVTKEIVVSAGPTELMPGPAISTLSKAGIPAKVEGGKIAIIKNKVVAKPGDVITLELAGVLNMLKMKPIEIGLDLVAVYEDGMIYEKDVLGIDDVKLIADMNLAYNHAFNLAIETGFPTRETIKFMVTKAFMNAKTLALEANILTKETVEDILAKAKAQADVLKEKVGE